MVERRGYLNKLIYWRDKKVIKVVSGVRRCGKSTLFLQYIEYLKKNGVGDENIIFINLEDLEFEELLDYKSLYSYITSKMTEGRMNYIFIDEVQNCKNFEKAVDSLFIKDNTDVYITGSNAYMLSGELATLLSGRYVEIEMLPLSFKEFILANMEAEIEQKGDNEAGSVKGAGLTSVEYISDISKNFKNHSKAGLSSDVSLREETLERGKREQEKGSLNDGIITEDFKNYFNAFKSGTMDINHLFGDYMNYGAFPYVSYLSKDEKIINDYIEGIYNTIIVKDIAKREGIKDVMVLENIVRFLCSNIGSPVSAKKIADTINSSGRKISVNTVDSYLKALTDSFIFYKVDRYNIKGRQLLKTLGKYYIVDSGFRSLIISSKAGDIGHILENIIYLELIRRGYKVNIGKVDDREVDFIAREGSSKVYYQVSASVLSEDTLNRELASLKKIKDNYPKYILTLDSIGANKDYDGIKVINAVDWLIG